MIAALLLTAIQVTTGWQGALEPLDWARLGSSPAGDTVMYVRLGRTPDQVWVRYENAASQDDAASSSVQLMQADCEAGTYVVLQAVVYADSNLAGASEIRKADLVPMYPVPGSFADMAVSVACPAS